MDGGSLFKTGNNLMDVIIKAFSDPNKEDTGVFEITTMNQSDKTVDEHVQDIKLAVHKSGVGVLPDIGSMALLITEVASI
jgi:hypothetical protein